MLSDGAIVGEHILNVRAAHSERLMSSVEALMAAAGARPGDLDVIACGVGPGSFTGVRIGVSLCKAMAYALSIPMVSVPSLDALAYGRGRGARVVWSLVDARHGRCYSASFVPPVSGGVWLSKRVSSYAIRHVDEVLALARESVSACGSAQGGARALFVGDGALTYAQSLLEGLPGAAEVPPAPMCILRPSQVGLLGMEMFREGRGGDPRTAVPMYLRLAEAEIKLVEGKR